MEPLLVRSVMTSPAVVVAPWSPLPSIKHIMREHKIRRVPVVEQQRLVGIITLGDVRNAFPSDIARLCDRPPSSDLDHVIAAEIMRTDVITVNANVSLVDAARLMLEHKIGGLPVVDGSLLIGIITESDVLRAVIDGYLGIHAQEAIAAV